MFYLTFFGFGISTFFVGWAIGSGAFKNKIRIWTSDNNLVEATEILFDEGEHQWAIYAVSEKEYYIYKDGQAMGDFDETTVKKYAKRRW